MKLTIRKKLLGLSLLAVILPLVVSATFIYMIVTTRSQEESFRKMSAFSRVANGLFEMRRDEILAMIEEIHPATVYYKYVSLFGGAPAEVVAGKPAATPEIDANQKKMAELVLQNLKKRARLDYVILTDPAGKVLYRTNGPATGDTLEEAAQLEQSREAARCTPVKLLLSFLNAEGLKDSATKLNVTGALALQAVVPIRLEKTLQGYLVAGDVFNNKNYLLDFFKRLVFSEDEMDAGSATLYMCTTGKDEAALAIATNRGGEAGRSLGAPIDKQIFDNVVKTGLEFTGPENIGNTSYVSSYIPLQNAQKQIVGILAVSVKETWFRNFQTRIRNVILLVIGIALLFSVVLTWFTAGRLTKPIETITEAADKISLGELDVAIQVRSSGDEISQLAESLERMRVSLKSAIERLRKR